MTIFRRFALSGCVLASLLLSATSQCPALVWSDEFDGTALDDTKWRPQIGDGCDLGICGWGNNELEYYRSENIDVSDGTLKITAVQEDYMGKQFTSARIRSLGLFDIDLMDKNLRLEARIKVPAGQGLWPAFWMLPSQVELTSWPIYGEVDIMEFIGREPNFAQGYMHYGRAWNDKSMRGGPLRLPTSPSEDFHVYTLEKTPDRMTWLLDGYLYQSYTPDDIEPVFNWPFESTFYFILNLAVGGNWPEYPDATTSFPSTLEVDYVRVYDLSNANAGHITGEMLVQVNQAGVAYCVEDGADGSLTWTVPEGAVFTETSSTCIEVTFGTSSGFVVAEQAQATCDAQTFSIPVEVHPFYVKEFSFLTPNSTIDSATYSSSTGSYSVADDIFDTAPAVTYVRNIVEVYDHLQLETTAIPDAGQYVSGDKKFYMDVRKTTSAPCTRVLVQLEDSTTSTPENYPTGRHSRYIAYIDDIDSWQRLEFYFYDRPDLSASSVDRILVLFDSFVERSDTYYFRNFDSAIPGCTDNCEPLSTNQCRVRAKSEAGACTDGFNNDGFGYDGDGPIDCEDSDCWDDPACLGTGPTPVALETTLVPTSYGQETTLVPTSYGQETTPVPSTQGLETTLVPITQFLETTLVPTLEGSTSEPTLEAPTPAGLTPGAPTPPPIVTTPVESICDDGIDNDGDGFTDCDDLDCASDPSCGSWSQPACSAHPSCSGLAADCCPTPFGVFLDCCDLSPASCSVNPNCTGLDGDCCPTPEGVYLDCCQPASCSVNPKCSGLGSGDGECCPGSDGVFLDCCEQSPSSCKIHPNCTDLDGSCCPTPEGVYLDCCEPAACSANPACSDLDGNCCPTSDGIFLDCCQLDIPTFAGSTISWLKSGVDIGADGGGSGSIKPWLHPLALLPLAMYVLA